MAYRRKTKPGTPEEHDIVIAEGTVQARTKDGVLISLVFCDVFEMKEGLIKKLTSYLMTVPGPDESPSWQTQPDTVVIRVPLAGYFETLHQRQSADIHGERGDRLSQ